MGEYLGLRTVAAARADMRGRSARWDGARAAAPTVPAAELPRPDGGQAVLATWHQLLDAGRLQDGEPFLAGTASARSRALLVGRHGRRRRRRRGRPADGVLRHRAGSRCRWRLTDMADHVVWLPTCSPGSAVRASLGADAGAVVTITKGGAA